MQLYGVSRDVRLGKLRGRGVAWDADAATQSLLAGLFRKAGISAGQAEPRRRRIDQKYRVRR